MYKEKNVIEQILVIVGYFITIGSVSGISNPNAGPDQDEE